jgi:hypothetical protein
LQKTSKKLLSVPGGAVPTLVGSGLGARGKSFLLLFFKKEVLASLCFPTPAT